MNILHTRRKIITICFKRLSKRIPRTSFRVAWVPQTWWNSEIVLCELPFREIETVTLIRGHARTFEKKKTRTCSGSKKSIFWIEVYLRFVFPSSCVNLYVVLHRLNITSRINLLTFSNRISSRVVLSNFWSGSNGKEIPLDDYCNTAWNQHIGKEWIKPFSDLPFTKVQSNFYLLTLICVCLF